MSEESKVPWAMIAHLAYSLKLDEAQCEKIGEVVSQWQSDMFVCSDVFAKCESPIERLFLLATMLNKTRCAYKKERYGAIECGVPGTNFTISIRPQVEIVDIESEDEDPIARADFELRISGGSRSYAVLVECDGHEFHEKTKEQVARDKSRDRKIVALGHRILRFSGSEIYGAPVKCLNECVDALLRIQQEDAEDLGFTEHYAHSQGFKKGYSRRGESIARLADSVLNAADWNAVVPLLRAHGFGVDYKGKFWDALLKPSDHPDLLAAIRLQLDLLPKTMETECEPVSP